MNAPSKLGPNSRQLCGTRAARITHRALSQQCWVCWPGDGIHEPRVLIAPQPLSTFLAAAQGGRS